MRDDATFTGAQTIGVEPFDGHVPAPAKVGHQLSRATQNGCSAIVGVALEEPIGASGLTDKLKLDALSICPRCSPGNVGLGHAPN